MAGLRIRFLLAATLALSTGGLFRSASTRGTRSTGGPTPHLWRELPGHQVRLRQGEPVRDHAALRRPLRAQLHLLRHDHQTGAAGELALTAGTLMRPRRA